MYKKNKVLGIIPARGNSKRVKKKNIKNLAGKPLIAYTIEAALKSHYLDKVIVSTDDDEISEVSMKYGCEVPFKRPSQLACDDSSDRSVLMHVVEWFKQNENYSVDAVVILRPTTPLKTAELIDQVVERLFETTADSIRTVTQVHGVNHPYWMYKKDNDSKAIPVIEGINFDEYYQSQLLPPVYRLNGVVDLIKVDTLLKDEHLYGQDMILHEIPEEISIDIDTLDDFEYCEYLLKK